MTMSLVGEAVVVEAEEVDMGVVAEEARVVVEAVARVVMEEGEAVVLKQPAVGNEDPPKGRILHTTRKDVIRWQFST
jgi:hypothetical protein